MEQLEWERLSPEEKKIELYRRQKRMLSDFLKRNAISQSQYEKSITDLTEKMEMHQYFDQSDVALFE